jgi:hypothetical protein
MQLLEDFNRDYQRYRHDIKEKAFLGLNGLQHVLSSNVSSVGVKENNQIVGNEKGKDLIIRFHNGSMYSYRNRGDDYEKLLNSNSKGKWVWRNLRRKNVPYVKIGVLPLPDDLGVTDDDIFQEIDNRYVKDLTRHVDVPIFQSFEFINGMSMQKILIGNIATYVPVTKPIPIEKSFKEVEKETKEKLQDNVGTVFINSKTIDKDMVEKSGTQLEKLLKRYKMKINSISFGSQAINTLLGQNVLTVKNQVYAFDYPLFNNPYTKQDILLKSNDSDKYKELVLKGWLTKVDEQNIMIATATHEFAHSLWNNTYQNWKIQHNKRYGIEEDEEIKMGKQLKSLFQKYKKEVQLDPLQLISRYSLTNVNEFLAEGFTQATLSSNPSPYALEIKKIIDEYLGVNNDN